MVLILALPVQRAFVSTVNIAFVVLNILGFMGMCGYNYSMLTYCTLTMAIGFCVDYTCARPFRPLTPHVIVASLCE